MLKMANMKPDVLYIAIEVTGWKVTQNLLNKHLLTGFLVFCVPEEAKIYNISVFLTGQKSKAEGTVALETWSSQY
jgi:hypothetical protein